MSENPFATPSSGGKITDYEGKLLIVTPVEFREGIPTSIGNADVVVANLVVVDEKKPTESEEVPGVFIFQKVLVGNLRPLIDTRQPMLGRLAKRAATKAGMSPAWVLDPATAAETSVAMKYWEAAKANPFA